MPTLRLVTGDPCTSYIFHMKDLYRRCRKVQVTRRMRHVIARKGLEGHRAVYTVNLSPRGSSTDTYFRLCSWLRITGVLVTSMQACVNHGTLTLVQVRPILQHHQRACASRNMIQHPAIYQRSKRRELCSRVCTVSRRKTSTTLSNRWD